MRCTKAKQGLGSKGMGREVGTHVPGVDVAKVGGIQPGAATAVSDSAVPHLGQRQLGSGSLAVQHSSESHSSLEPLSLPLPTIP